jgi:hypothetical protein
MARRRLARVRAGRHGALAVTLVAALALSSVSGATTTTIDPGRLPQTTGEPSMGAALTHQMTLLWRAIIHDNAAAARRVFFPESAYVRMKTGLIPSPAGDYTRRLIGLYLLDLKAYQLLITDGGGSTLVRVSLHRADAAWIAPGHCENLIGYWHLPGVRLVYRHGTGIYSVAVFSLISWRGVWYVVHLGPNPRPTNVGTVDGYAVGPGHPGPAGGC